MNKWTNTYMFGVALFGYIAIVIAGAHCLKYFNAMIKRKFPDKRKRNDIENAVFKCLAACWLLTSFFGVAVFFLSAICMLVTMIFVLFLFDDASTK